MSAAVRANTRMGRATLASVGIHALVALMIPALAWTVSSSTPVETVSFTKILHIQIKPTVPPKPPPRALAPSRSVKTTVSLSNHVKVVAAAPRLQAAAQRRPAANAAAAPAVGAFQRPGTGTAESNAVPNVTPSPEARAVASEGTKKEAGGYLPFGAEQPDPVLDPGIRKQLAALNTHVTLTVTVDEDGHTKEIVFTPPVDAQLEARIRSLLADATWDPAVCGGGVACEAQATIKL